MRKMPQYVVDRVIKEANFLINTNKNLRDISYEFGNSLGNVHDDLNKRLPNIDYDLYLKVREIIDIHILENQLKFINYTSKSKL